MMYKNRILRVVILAAAFVCLALVINQTAIAKDEGISSFGEVPIFVNEPTPIAGTGASTTGDIENDADLQALSQNYSDSAPEIKSESTYTVTLGAWRNMRPTESYLYGVSMLDDDYPVNCVDKDQKSRGWIVGSAGTILSYCNGLWDQAIVVESLPTTLYDVQALTPELGIAVGDQSAILLYTYDAIADDFVWIKPPIAVGNQLLYSVYMVEDGNGGYEGWIVGKGNGGGTIIHGKLTPGAMINGYQSYNYQFTNMTDQFSYLPDVQFYFGLQMLSLNDGWVSGGKEGERGVVLHWNGIKWEVTELGTHELIDLYMRSSSDGWAVGTYGAIYHYNGSSWSPVESPTSESLFGVGFSSDGRGWAVGMNGLILNYDGNSWKYFENQNTDAFDYWKMDFTDSQGWMVGFHDELSIGGQILEYVDGSWYAVTPPTDNQLIDVAIVSDTDAWAVGRADERGGTLVHWNGKHWVRWLQKDVPIPAADLWAIHMNSANSGWAAGDPLVSGAPAVMLHWDGKSWSQSRLNSPLNVKITSLDMLDESFGWAVAENGDAIAKYDNFDGVHDYWSANHSCQGIYYNLRSVSVLPASWYFDWDAWAVGTSLNPSFGEVFLKYLDGCSGGYAWDVYQQPIACPNPDMTYPSDGAWQTTLQTVEVEPDEWGLSGGDYKGRASVYYYNGSSWSTAWCHPTDIGVTPSRVYSVDIIPESGVGWFGGYYTSSLYKRKVAFIQYWDAVGIGWGGVPFPVNGTNIYHRPIKRIRMSSDTMGWAVGDPEDEARRSVIYQYPYPNFVVDATPESSAVIPGGTVTFIISANTLGGFDANVNLSLDTSGLPAGFTNISLSSSVINKDTESVLTVETLGSLATGNYPITVIATATFRSGDNDFTVRRESTLNVLVNHHIVESVQPESGPSGTQVIIKGKNFGLDPGVGNRSTEAYHVVLAGRQIPSENVLSWTNTQIIVSVPNDISVFEFGPQHGPVIVESANYSSNLNFSFQYENEITSLEYERVGESYQITLSGTGFGPDPGYLYRSTSFERVEFNGEWVPSGDVNSWDNNTIVFLLPASTTGGWVNIASNGFVSNQIEFLNSGTRVFLPMLTHD